MAARGGLARGKESEVLYPLYEEKGEGIHPTRAEKPQGKAFPAPPKPAAFPKQKGRETPAFYPSDAKLSRAWGSCRS